MFMMATGGHGPSGWGSQRTAKPSQQSGGGSHADGAASGQSSRCAYLMASQAAGGLAFLPTSSCGPPTFTSSAVSCAGPHTTMP